MHSCQWDEEKLVDSLINKLPPLRELNIDVLPRGIRAGHLRCLEKLQVGRIEDWGCLFNETTASLKYLHLRAGQESLFSAEC
jgi:hypothetical protein